MKNALDNIFQSKKLLNTFQEALVTRPQGHFGSLSSTFRQCFADRGSFFVSAIPGIRGMLDWAQSVLDCSVSVDKGGEQVFICYVL